MYICIYVYTYACMYVRKLASTQAIMDGLVDGCFRAWMYVMQLCMCIYECMCVCA